ncbi:MAG: hypothetical protein IPL53_06070 [Ignavibacteria bacterium]|nr:hypothetical protein [Ignavibacteria bacterium]
MNKPNISAELTQQQKEQIKTAINQVKDQMSFLINLSISDRKTLFKMGSGSVGFVEEALNVSKNHGNILPSNFDVAEFEKDVSLTSSLTDIYSVLLPLTEGVSDTMMAVGSAALKQSNIVYAHVKLSAKNNSNLKEIQNRLGERYKQSAKATPKTNNVK